MSLKLNVAVTVMFSRGKYLGGFHLLAHGGGSRQNYRGGGYVVLERYLGGLSHIEKPFEGGGVETLHQLNPTSLY